MKIIGSDYDGTLNYKGFDERKIAALKRWREAGNVFALVSGRGSKDILRIYNETKFPCDYLLGDSGAVILKTDGTVISETRCEGSIARPLFTLLFEAGCTRGSVQAEYPCRVFADPADCTDPHDYTLETLPDFPYFTQISTVCEDAEKAAKVTACVKAHFGDRLNPLQNGQCIDIVRADMNKARGLHILMEHLGASHEDVITVGDNINDRDMIREFRSYAMANGVDAIKALADYITPGVAELIEKELNG